MISIAFSGLKFINNGRKKEKLLNIFKKIFSNKNKEKETLNDKLNGWIREYQQTRNEEAFNNIYKIYEHHIENKAKKEDNINIRTFS